MTERPAATSAFAARAPEREIFSGIHDVLQMALGRECTARLLPVPHQREAALVLPHALGDPIMTTPSIHAESNSDVSLRVAPRFVLLHEEARVRGFRNALAFKRWCVRRAVILKRDGKKLWVAPTDVDRAIEGLPARSAEPQVTSAVAAIQSRRR